MNLKIDQFQIVDQKIEKYFQLFYDRSSNHVIASRNTDGIKLNEINDDCLLKIFSNLNLLDLCAVCHTAKQFQSVAKVLFQKNQKIIDANEMNDYERNIILMSCGRQINKLSFGKNIFNTNFKMIVNTCTNLKSIEINSTTIDLKDHFCYKFKNFFNLLDEMIINNCTIVGNCTNFFNESKNLKTFEYRRNEIEPILPSTKFSHLINVIVIDCEFIDQIIDENNQIEKLIIFHHQKGSCLSNKINFHKLRKLELGQCCFQNIAIHSMDNLNSLNLYVFDENRILKKIDLLCQIATIQKLGLFYVESGETISHIIKKLKNLQELELVFHYSFDRTKWFVTLDENMKNLKTIKMNFFYNDENTLFELIGKTKNLIKLEIKHTFIKLDDDFMSKLANIYLERKCKLLFTITDRYVTASTAFCDSIKDIVEIKKID